MIGPCKGSNGRQRKGSGRRGHAECVDLLIQLDLKEEPIDMFEPDGICLCLCFYLKSLFRQKASPAQVERLRETIHNLKTEHFDSGLALADLAMRLPGQHSLMWLELIGVGMFGWQGLRSVEVEVRNGQDRTRDLRMGDSFHFFSK